MNTDFILELLEKGIIEGLFIVTFVLFVWKGIPYSIKKIEDINKEHKAEIDRMRVNFTNTLDKQTLSYENSLKLIVETFRNQSDKSIAWHEKHEKALSESISIMRNLSSKNR